MGNCIKIENESFKNVTTLEDFTELPLEILVRLPIFTKMEKKTIPRPHLILYFKLDQDLKIPNSNRYRFLNAELDSDIFCFAMEM